MGEGGGALERPRLEHFSADRLLKCFRPCFVDDFTGLVGAACGGRYEDGGDKGVCEKWMNTEVYPTAVKWSGSISLMIGVMMPLFPDPMEPRREARERDVRWPEHIEGLRRGDQGAGVPGSTSAAHEVMADIVADRRLPRGGLTGLATPLTSLGRDGRGFVGRFFCGGGGRDRNGYRGAGLDTSASFCCADMMCVGLLNEKLVD